MTELSILQWIAVISFFWLGTFQMGLDSGIMTGASLYFLPEFQIPKEEMMFKLSFWFEIGALIGTLLYMASYRSKLPYILSQVGVLLGSLLVFWSRRERPAIFFASRASMGLGVGLFSVSGPVLIANRAEISTRGVLVALGGIGISLGQTASFFLTGLIPLIPWQLAMASTAVPALVNLTISIASSQVLRWVSYPKTKGGKFCYGKVGVAVMVQLCQLFVGYKLVVTMVPKVVKNETTLSLALLTSSSVGVLVFRLFRRKLVLMLSVALAALDLIFLGFVSRESSEAYFLVLGYVSIFNVGLANLPMIYSIEVISKGSVGIGCGVVGAVNVLVSLGCTLSEDKLTPAIGEDKLLWSYAVLSIVMTSWTAYVMPETLPNQTKSVKKEEEKGEDLPK